jgi:FkbM family methyltransferase
MAAAVSIGADGPESCELTLSTAATPQLSRSLVKQFVGSIHRMAASRQWSAGRYLRLFRLAKYLPDDRWKNYVLNSLESVKWPDIALPPARVNLGPSITVSLIPHLQEFDFAAHLYRRMGYECEVKSWLQGRQYDAVIEIGANIGIYSLLFSRMWPACRISCFEPSRTAYRRLVENLALNDCRNVYPFNCAVASQTGFLEFHEPAGHLINGSLDRSFAQMFADSIDSTKVVAISGTEIAQLIPTGKRVLLKIDVEGAEPEVLGSLASFIAAERPDILIEVLPPTVDALNRIDVLRPYRFYQLDSDGPQQRDCFVAGKNRDYALIPRQSEPIALVSADRVGAA